MGICFGEERNSIFDRVLAYFGWRRPCMGLFTSKIEMIPTSSLNAGDDTDAAVASMRSIYREIKTQQVGATAEVVSRKQLAKA